MWGKLAKWRTFADVMAVALGVNLWVSLILLPGFSVGAWNDTAMLLNHPHTHGYAWGDVVRVRCQDDKGWLPLVLHVIEDEMVMSSRGSA